MVKILNTLTPPVQKFFLLLFYFVLSIKQVDITCYFDETFNRLFTTFRNLILMMEIKAEIKDRVMTHNKPVVASKLIKANNMVRKMIRQNN